MKPVEVIPVESDKPSEEDLSWEDKGEKIGDEIKVEEETDPGNFQYLQSRGFSKAFLSILTFTECIIHFYSKIILLQLSQRLRILFIF